MLISNKLIWKAPTIALTILALALTGYFLVETTFALNNDALPIAADSPRHENSAWHILAQATSNAPSAAAPTDSVPNHVIEQYKAYITDLGNVGAQLAMTQTFYLTIISALIAVLAFKDAIRPIQDYFASVSIVVFIFILLVSINWLFTAQQFENLIRAKFDVLRAIELKYPGLYPMFTKQSEYYMDHWAYGIIRHQSVLIVVIGLGALFITAAGIRWQIRNRNALKGIDVARAATLQTMPEEPLD
jgi:hypothetical protein